MNPTIVEVTLADLRSERKKIPRRAHDGEDNGSTNEISLGDWDQAICDLSDDGSVDSTKSWDALDSSSKGTEIDSEDNLEGAIASFVLASRA